MNAIVVNRAQFGSPLLAEFWPDWRVVRVGEALVGARFERIVTLARPWNEESQRWFMEELPLKLPPACNVEWLA